MSFREKQEIHAEYGMFGQAQPFLHNSIQSFQAFYFIDGDLLMTQCESVVFLAVGTHLPSK